jgi:hypothetical protein
MITATPTIHPLEVSDVRASIASGGSERQTSALLM